MMDNFPAMDSTARLPVQMLGQSGCKLRFPGATLYVDPYLSNSVQELDAPDLVRQAPIPFPPEQVTDADWVLITHAHIDHCDPHTLPKLAAASPQARFLAPPPVARLLADWGIGSERIQIAREQWSELAPGVCVHAIPAAHPEIERDAEGYLSTVGYLLEYVGRRLYLAGDTFARQEIIDTLQRLGPVHTAFLPVNEHNVFRAQRGILGNMSVREAFGLAEAIGARQVVAVHWDMFAANETTPEEIRAVYRRQAPNFGLLLSPTCLNLAEARLSLVIRTLNEARHLDALLTRVAAQRTPGLGHEVIIVDSGSTDGTLDIAERHGCRILHISREEFSFGRSLNLGCEAARGDILVITSGHCVPTDDHWLQRLCQPLLDNEANYSFGRQLGGERSHYSEQRIFAKYFPERTCNGQKEFFCNNANAALRYSDWERLRFSEELTGLEDMELAQRLVREGGRVVYVPEAAVYHYHEETWPQIRRRFEREAIALQRIMPHVHVSPFDVVRYIGSSVIKDWRSAWREGVLARQALDIVRYRRHQYLGVYKGNNEHRKLSHAEKEKYFFPE
jgi:L-ascorbate metabolism protein UlaG (beta-lactamase superfamily)/glycosyltransferase involved in cell wall biosynthesis